MSSLPFTLKNHQPIITGRWDRRLIGYYISPSDILNNPGFLDTMQEKFGVNVLLCGHPLSYPKEILEKNPLKGKGFIAQRFTEDDTSLHKAIEETPNNPHNFYFRGVALLKKMEKVREKDLVIRKSERVKELWEKAYSSFTEALKLGLNSSLCQECGYKTNKPELSFCTYCGKKLRSN